MNVNTTEGHNVATKIFYDDQLLGIDLTEAEFDALTAGELRKTIEEDSRWVCRDPVNGGLTLHDTQESVGPYEFVEDEAPADIPGAVSTA
jgi:hypothetical protein